MGSGIPSRVSLLILHTQADSICLLLGFFPISAAAAIYSYHQPPSGQSQVYQVKQLGTDGVHCRKFAGTGPVVFQGSSSNGCCLVRFHHGPISTTTWYQVYASLSPSDIPKSTKGLTRMLGTLRSINCY